MKSLNEMTVAELESLKADVTARIRQGFALLMGSAILTEGRYAGLYASRGELVNFRNDIDNELDKRGA